MITTILPFVLLFTVYPSPINTLRCYHCSHPSRQIAQNLWIHKTQTCTRRKLMLCPIESVACVIVRVSHPLLSFTASGCSEDKFIGCDLHNLKNINTTMKRCQCSTSYCNKDLHMKKFHITTISTSNHSNHQYMNLTSNILLFNNSNNKVNNKNDKNENNNKTSNYHIQLLDKFTSNENRDTQKQQNRLEMLRKQKELQKKEQKLYLNTGISNYLMYHIFVYFCFCLFAY